MLDGFLDLLRSSVLLRGLVYGGGFALVELSFTSLMKEKPDGTLRFAPALDGHTTWAMVPGSILGGIYVLEPFLQHLHPFHDFWWDLGLRLALWPVVIWLIEIIWGALLFYGCNGTRAWHYRGKGARLNGFIKLTYAHYWVGMGALVEALFWALEIFPRR